MQFLHTCLQALKKRFLTTRFFVGICITCLVVSLQFVGINQVQVFFDRFEGILYDIRLNTTLSSTPRTFEERVVIIDIDEKSMQEQGRYPWSRSKVAELVEKLHQAGVVVIAFDILFAEPERNPVDEILTKNKQLNSSFVNKISALSASVNADEIFANTLENAEVILGFLFDNSAKTVGYLPSSSIKWEENANNTSQIASFKQVLGNIQTLQTAALGAGFINSLPESDGFIRKASLVLNYNNTLHPSLALETARIYTLNDSIQTLTKSSQNMAWLQGIRLGKQVIPTNEKGQILIPFKGKAKSFEYIPATDVLNNRIKEGVLDGAIAFVGTSAVGLADLRTTSVGVQYPGVEVHANVFESLIHPEIIPVEPSEGLAISLFMLILTGIVLAFSLTKQTPGKILLISLAMFVFHTAVNWYLWTVFKISLPLFQLLLLITLMTLYYASIGFMIESYKRKNIKGLFDQYVPPAYIDKMIKEGKNLDHKSEKRNMSVMFADIRSFTKLSENFTPEELAEFLQIYLTDVTSIIFDQHGTIDKYVGDMVMAFWNAPIEDKNHATNAVLTALKMITATKHLSKKFNQRNWPSINIGIGISSGLMSVGDMGSTYRKAYTVLGDEVNLGSRIESLTKFYGVDILISENTVKQLAPNHIVLRQIDYIKVVGKDQAVKVYQPLCSIHHFNKGITPDERVAIEENLALHQKGINAYTQAEWDIALKIFAKLKQKCFFSTTIYDVYTDRILLLKDSTTLSDWDGTYSHQSK